MENMTPWGVFWVAFFGSLPATLPIIVTQILAHRRAMAELRLNTELTAQTQSVAVDAATKVIETADKVDSATRNQVSTAQAAASIAKVAAKDAKETAMDAKITAGTTTTAIRNLSGDVNQLKEKLSGDVNQLKEFVNGYLTQRLQEASKSGYAIGVSDTIGKKVDEQGAKVDEQEKRLVTVETKIDRVEEKVGTILELVRANNGERTQVRGESR